MHSMLPVPAKASLDLVARIATGHNAAIGTTQLGHSRGASLDWASSSGSGSAHWLSEIIVRAAARVSRETVSDRHAWFTEEPSADGLMRARGGILESKKGAVAGSSGTSFRANR